MNEETKKEFRNLLEEMYANIEKINSLLKGCNYKISKNEKSKIKAINRSIKEVDKYCKFCGKFKNATMATICSCEILDTDYPDF